MASSVGLNPSRVLAQKVLDPILSDGVAVLVRAQDDLASLIGLYFVGELAQERVTCDLLPPLLAFLRGGRGCGHGYPTR
jgi:hypothetical protein